MSIGVKITGVIYALLILYSIYHYHAFTDHKPTTQERITKLFKTALENNAEVNFDINYMEELPTDYFYTKLSTDTNNVVLIEITTKTGSRIGYAFCNQYLVE